MSDFAACCSLTWNTALKAVLNIVCAEELEYWDENVLVDL